MSHFFQNLGDFIAQHSAMAGVILGAVIFVESLAIVGAFVPATALMVLVGGLLAAGVLNPVEIVICCVIGAVLGDAVSYEIGRRLGARSLRGPLFRNHRRAIARARLFCRQYGSASIYIGRFFGPARAFVPLLTGMMAMSRRRFQFANVGSALVWVPVMLAPGWLAAKGLAELEQLVEADRLTLVLAIGAGLTLASFLGWRAIVHRMRRREALIREAARECG
ncbi:MAG: DedA family protein [Caulobacteraceae bacterium]|nr:DedA family protein [Caulobacteraceae bacterium]